MKNSLEQIPIPLLSWYAQNARELPWREQSADPYRVWVSEIMLQQTRVTAVLGYYARFMERFPSIEALAMADEESLMKTWQGLGYYRRARNLQKAAKQVMEIFDGVFPRSYADLLSLSGIGEYTASAIASICFGEPYPAVDGNLLRVVARLTADGEDITSTSMKKKVTASLKEVIPLHAAGEFNQAMMDLGAMICLPNGAPLCDRCPLAEVCRAYALEKVDLFPYRKPKKARRIEEKKVYLIVRDDKVALRRRDDTGLLAGLWEYPSDLTYMENIETQYIGQAKHIFTHIEWHMSVHLCLWRAKRLPEDWIWVSRDELEHTYPIPTAFARATKMFLEIKEK